MLVKGATVIYELGQHWFWLGNDLSPERHQTITWTNDDLLSICPSGINLTDTILFRPQWVKCRKSEVVGSKPGVSCAALTQGQANMTQTNLPKASATREINLHRLISAAIGRRVTSDPAELPFLLGGKSCAQAPLNIIPKFPKEKHKFLSNLSSKSSTFMCSICMIAKGYKVFPWTCWKLCQSKNGVCDQSPPKRRTVAETFAWRL